MGMVLVAIVAVVAMGLYFKSRDDAERQAAQASLDSLRLAVSVERSERAAEHARDSIASLRAIQVADAALGRARRSADIQGDSMRVLLDSLSAILPDTLDPFVQRILASYNELQRTFDRTLAAADSAIAVRDEWIESLERTYATDLAKCDSTVTSALAQTQRALRLSRPGLIARVSRALPYLAGAYLVGHLTK